MAIVFSSTAQWLCLCTWILWLAQLSQSANKKEITSYIDLVKVGIKWRVKDGLLSRGEFANRVSLAPVVTTTSPIYSKLTVAKNSTFVIQKHTTKEIEQFLNGTKIRSVMESLSTVLYKKYRPSGEPLVLVEYFNQLVKNETLKGIIPAANSSSMAGAVVTLLSDGAEKKLCKGPCNLVESYIANKSSVSVSSGSKAILKEQVACETGIMCESRGMCILPNSTQTKEFRIKTSVGPETRKGFVLMYDAVMYDRIIRINQTSDETVVQRRTGVVVRFVLLNQDCMHQVYTFAQNCTGTAEDAKSTNPNCTFASSGGQGTQPAIQSSINMTALLFMAAFGPLQGYYYAS